MINDGYPMNNETDKNLQLILKSTSIHMFLKKYLFALKEAYRVYISINESSFKKIFFEKGVLFLLAS